MDNNLERWYSMKEIMSFFLYIVDMNYEFFDCIWFDFQLIAIALELLVLFRSAFHRQQAVRRGEKDNRVMIQPFI